MEETQKSREMTFGEKMVGVNFNPSGQEGVDYSKKQCADLIDLMHKLSEGTSSNLQKDIADNAIIELLKAQMLVVKALTFRN